MITCVGGGDRRTGGASGAGCVTSRGRPSRGATGAFGSTGAASPWPAPRPAARRRRRRGRGRRRRRSRGRPAAVAAAGNRHRRTSRRRRARWSAARRARRRPAVAPVRAAARRESSVDAAPAPARGTARSARRAAARSAAADRVKADVLLRADVDRREVLGRQLVRAHDVRRQQHDDVGLVDRVGCGPEERSQHRHVQHAGESGQRFALVVPQQAGEQVRLPFAQPQPRLDLPRSERRHVLAGDADRRRRACCSRRSGRG